MSLSLPETIVGSLLFYGEGIVQCLLNPFLGPVYMETPDGEVTCGGSPHLSCKRF